MTTVITLNDGSGQSVSPTLVLGYETSRDSQNIVHDIIGGGIAVTLIRSRPPSGTLNLFFTDEAAAFEALELFGLETSFTLSDTDRPSINMTFIAVDSSTLRLSDSRRFWTFDLGYQEVDVT